MSLILDALNRSRQETDSVPNLATAHAPAQASPDLRGYLPWAALAVAVLLIAWLLLDRGNGEAVSDAGIVAPVAQLSQNVGSAAADVTAKLKSRAAAQRESKALAQAPPARANPAESGKAIQSEKSAEQLRAQVAIAVEAASAKNKSSASSGSKVQTKADADAVAALYQKRDPTQATVTVETAGAEKILPIETQRKIAVKPTSEQSEEPLDIEKILQMAKEEAGSKNMVEHPAPFISSLSQYVKDGIPTILYQQHDYANAGARSSVMLNGKSLRVGGSPGSSVKVDEILPDSVVLSHGGTQFRLRALNSWVNL
ncbi:MAG: general secretion pathway protein B [Halioglobus sp.]